MSASPPEISVVIPVYKAEDCLHELHRRLTDVLSTLVSSYEIILVEDRGPDNSWQVLSSIAASDSHVKAYRLSRNFGQHAAITAGLKKCAGRWAVVMDCDLQDPPEFIPALYQKAQSGFEIVLARRKQKQYSLFRKLAASVYFSLLNRITGKAINGEYGSFSLISRRVIDAYLQVPDHNRHYLFILYWLGFDTTDIEYEHAARFSGESSYSFRRLLKHALEGLFFQTNTLLRWIVYMGFMFSLMGMLAVVYLVYRYFTHSVLSGWTSLAVLILTVGGVVLICLGMVGLYVGQVFEQVKGRPLYVIDDEITGDSPA